MAARSCFDGCAEKQEGLAVPTAYPKAYHDEADEKAELPHAGCSRLRTVRGSAREEDHGTCSQSFKRCCGGLLGEKKHVACAPRATGDHCRAHDAYVHATS